MAASKLHQKIKFNQIKHLGSGLNKAFFPLDLVGICPELEKQEMRKRKGTYEQTESK